MRRCFGFEPSVNPELTSPPVLVDGAVFSTATDFDGLAALGDVPERDSEFPASSTHSS